MGKQRDDDVKTAGSEIGARAAARRGAQSVTPGGPYQRGDAAFCLVDPDNRVVMATEGWLRAVGCSRDQVLGRDISAFLPEMGDLAAALRGRPEPELPPQRFYRPGLGDREGPWEVAASQVSMAGGAGLLVSMKEASAESPAESEQDMFPGQTAPTMPRSEHEQLEICLEQMTSAREEAEARTSEMETILEAVPDGILVADRDGKVVEANSALVDIFGFRDRQEALRPVTEYPQITQIQYSDGRPVPVDQLAMVRALRGEKTQLREMRLLLRDGTERVAEISASPVLDDQGTVIHAVAVVRDVTDRKRWQRQRQTLARVAQALGRRLELQAVLETVMEQTLQGLGADATSIFLAEPDQRELTLVAFRGYRPESMEQIRRMPFDAPYAAARAFTTGEIQVAERLASVGPELSGARDFAEAEGLSSLLAVPLRAADQLVGAMSLATRTPRRFTQDDLDTIARVADLFGVAIKDARLFQEAQQRAAELDATISSIPDVIVIYDPSGNIVRMNAAARRLFAFSKEEQELPLAERMLLLRTETPSGRLFPSEEFPTSRALRGETVRGTVAVIHPRNHRPVWVSVSAAPIRNAKGELIGAVLDLSDITSLRKLQEQRAQYVLGVSHGLRTPLTVVQGQAQLLVRTLERAGLDGPLNRSARAIVANSQRMSAMLRDLVDLMQLEAGQPLKLNRAPLDPRAFILEMKDRVSGLLQMDRVRLEAPEGLPRVLADPDRLERILLNLLSNALEYSDPGTEVTVTLNLRDGMVVTSVTDRGPGIPAEQLPYLFQPYRRPRQARGHPESLGLGLYITRGLVEAHGGSIWVEGEPKGGSTFSFTLPVA